MAEQNYTVGEPIGGGEANPQQSGGSSGGSMADFGMYSWAMSDPAVADILTRAKNEGWTPDKLQFELTRTHWWRTQEDSVRAWNTLIAQNPQEALNRRANEYDRIERLAASMGVTIHPDVLLSYADSSLRYSWNDVQLRNSLLTNYEYSSKPGGVAQFGAAAETTQQIKRLAGEYIVPLDDRTIRDWTIRVLQGISTVDSFKAYLAQVAAADNPWMKSALDQGFTVKDVMSPYINRVAQELGMTPDEIDMSEPKWRQLLEVTDDKGERIRPNTQQVLKIVRNDDRFGWDKTEGAVTTAAQFATSLAQQFGAI